MSVSVVGVVSHAVRMAMQLAWALPGLVVLETLFPRTRPSWFSRLRALVIWAVYVAISAVLLSLCDGVLAAVHTHALLWTLPPAMAAVFAVILSDFLYYWFHRAQHRWFWRFHAVHHSIRELSGVNSYHHWIEELLRLPLIGLPIALLAPSGPRLPIIGTLIMFQTYYLHAPTRLNFGKLRVFIADNRYHRLHHSMESRHYDRNFAATLPLWDILFGTAIFPGRDEWPDVGLPDAPEPEGVRAYLVRGLAPIKYTGAVKAVKSPASTT